MKTFVYPTSGVRVTAVDEMAFAKVSGVVTQADAARIIAGSAAWGSAVVRPLVNIVCYSAAAIAVNADQLLESAGRAQWSMASVARIPPTALVVSGETLSMWRDYVACAMAAGVLKAVFLNHEDAVRWAAQQAAVRAHWNRLRHEARSSQEAPHIGERACR
jgi:hypothetical protein